MISFESGSNWYEAAADRHHFHGVMDGAPIHCVISQVAVAALGSDRKRTGRPSDIFDAIEHRVFALAERKVLCNGRDARGVVAINSRDIALLN